MTNRLIFVVILLNLAANADAEYVSGNTLHEICQLNTTEATAEPTCVFFIVGALDMYYALQYATNAPEPTFCRADTSIRQQSVDVVRNYLEDHPETRHFEAIALILASMEDAFPCEGDNGRSD